MRAVYAGLTVLALASTPAVADDARTRVEVRPLVGTVVEYVPQRTIVLRDADQRVVTYTLSPQVVVPAGIAVGKSVRLVTEPGGTVVREVTMTSVTPEGNIQQQTTRTSADGSTSTTTITRTGRVVRYVPGQSIVVRGPDEQVVTYTVGPDLAIPVDVKVGTDVTLYVDDPNSNVVRKVTTVSMTPEGDRKVTTRTTETQVDGTRTTTEVTTIEGVVSAYEASKTVTVERPDGTMVTYYIDPSSVLPPSIDIGKKVSIEILPGPKRIVRRMVLVSG